MKINLYHGCETYADRLQRDVELHTLAEYQLFYLVNKQ